MKKATSDVLRIGLLLFAVSVFYWIIFNPVYSITKERVSAEQQTARSIALCLFVYAQNHDGHYPDGKTSTEVFQQLIDEGYITDSAIFYAKLPGKIRTESKQLKAENVGWDVTCCVDSTSPDELPVVFLDGYKITYQAGSRAVPFDQRPRTWGQWLHRFVATKKTVAVCYKDRSARSIQVDADGSVPDFIPTDFDPKGKTYRQLTP